MHIDPVLKDELKQYLLDRMHESHRKVTIISAYPLSQQEMDSIIHKFPELGNARVENEVDLNTYAGFIIKFGTKRIDLSLKRRIEEVHQSLTHTLE